ncbi:MAG: tRNA (N(6)-L-threonylcarbamoyladenosine(37)-C(2))-methylthiotransferase MtaB [Patescibacteria group bacterium]
MNYQFFIQSLGCKVNQYDGASLASSLESLGFKQSPEKPDLVVINTCTVTKNAITKDRQSLNLLKRKYPQAKFVVMGCWPETSDQALDSFDSDGVFWWGVGKRVEFLHRVKEWFSINEEKYSILESGLAITDDWSRYFLKVGDGCDQFCAYCLIPYARGKIKSRPLAELISEAKRAIEAGFEEIVLAGIHLGRYGQDFPEGEASLNNLLKSLLKLPGLGRIRLSSIEINEVDDELIDLIKKNPQICRHLHISLQSGCDKILKLMRRPYDTKYFKDRINLIRKSLPEISLTTDVIVGFPGETTADFVCTKKFIEEIAFNKIHVFPFSAHKKTPAFLMPHQVDGLTAKARAKELREISTKFERIYRQKIITQFQGKKMPLILEALISDTARLKTEFYFDLILPLSKLELSKEEAIKKIGKIIMVSVKEDLFSA